MSDQKPRVSIGLPVYNAEKYIEQALDSILAQNYSDFELIISDNASTDRTQEICQTYSAIDKRIRYYRNDNNLGIAPNFNRVFELSSGEYFKWAAHDDLIAPDFLPRCVEVLDQNPAVVLCYSRAKMINEDGEFVVNYDPGPETGSLQPQYRFRNLILHPEYALQQMGLIRARALKKTSLHASFPSSDEVLLAELAMQGQFYEIMERMFYYRYYSGQLTQSKTPRERVVAYDTSLEGKIVLHKWLYFFACIRAINNSPIHGRERVYCYMQMVRWVLRPDHLRAMGKDILLAAIQSFIRNFRRIENKTPQAT